VGRGGRCCGFIFRSSICGHGGTGHLHFGEQEEEDQHMLHIYEEKWNRDHDRE
jgi:hypothetical protein